MKIICIGRNYRDHCHELNSPIPLEPVFFMKPDTALLIRNRPFYIPEFTNDLHYEVELVIKINKLGKGISEEFAHLYYDQIGIGIDFTARDVQRRHAEKGLPWEKAKAFDFSAPMGKFFSKESFPDMSSIEFRLDLNGNTVQKGHSANMIFSFDKIISYVSQFITLRTGDYIYTGTPAGVGAVKQGDLLEAWLHDEKCLKCQVK